MASKQDLKFRRNVETIKLSTSASKVVWLEARRLDFQEQTELVDIVKRIIQDLEGVYQRLSANNDEIVFDVSEIIDRATRSLSTRNSS